MILTGGAARSMLWPQILADVLGSPVSVPDHVESAALGAAVLAAAGPGSRCPAPRRTIRRGGPGEPGLRAGGVPEPGQAAGL